jgi:ubiquinone/menaquinone biosynthesis C-methylase UbiE
MSNRPRRYDWAELPEEARRLEAQAKALEPITSKELKIMDIHPNMKILDAGCGTGAVTRKIAQLSKQGISIGIDLDPLFIETAKTLAENEGISNILFEQGNIDEISYEDGFFDRAYCRLVLMHVDDPVKTVRELIRVTKKGGLVAISDNDDGIIISYPHAPKFQELWKKFGQMSGEKGMNRYIGRELFSILSQAGLSSIQVFPFPMHGTQENPAMLRGLVSVPMQILATSKDKMVEEGWFTEEEYREMVIEVEKALSHLGAFALGMSFFATGIV